MGNPKPREKPICCSASLLLFSLSCICFWSKPWTSGLPGCHNYHLLGIADGDQKPESCFWVRNLCSWKKLCFLISTLCIPSQMHLTFKKSWTVRHLLGFVREETLCHMNFRGGHKKMIQGCSHCLSVHAWGHEFWLSASGLFPSSFSLIQSLKKFISLIKPNYSNISHNCSISLMPKANKRSPNSNFIFK